MGVASLVLGIAAVVFSVFPILFGYWGAVILGVVGIILGALGKKSNAKCATGGLVCAIIGTCLSGLMLIACSLCASAAGGVLGAL
ncbi:MAG: hypothetical protein E7433_06785 [Ruminococcaceae bacterium]|nr:hypothetical protein [Oscillospiraceae bacterium]